MDGSVGEGGDSRMRRRDIDRGPMSDVGWSASHIAEIQPGRVPLKSKREWRLSAVRVGM